MREKKSKSWILNLVSFLNILTVSGTYGVNFRAYGRENFTEVFWLSDSTTNSSNLSSHKPKYVYSVKTDTCFVLYSRRDCKSDYSTKYMPGVINYIPNKVYLSSLHICSEADGGSQLNVDFTEFHRSGNIHPTVFQSFKKVCSCVNIPESMQILDRWSIDNHHIELLAYYELNCFENKWNSMKIAARHNWYSRDVHKHTKTDGDTNTMYKILSFGPDPNSPCFQISCSGTHVTTESTNTFQSTTERDMDVNADCDKQFEVLTNQIMEFLTS